MTLPALIALALAGAPTHLELLDLRVGASKADTLSSIGPDAACQADARSPAIDEICMAARATDVAGVRAANVVVALRAGKVVAVMVSGIDPDAYETVRSGLAQRFGAPVDFGAAEARGAAWDAQGARLQLWERDPNGLFASVTLADLGAVVSHAGD